MRDEDIKSSPENGDTIHRLFDEIRWIMNNGDKISKDDIEIHQ
jgi:hypothetical protein